MEGERADEAQQRHAELLNALVSAQQEIAAARPDPDTIMNLVVERAQKLTGADGAAIELVEGEEMVYRAACGIAAAQSRLRLKIATSFSGLCVRTDEILRCDDVELDPPADRGTYLSVGARSIVAVPLRQQYNSVGTLKVVSTAPMAFGETEIQTLQLVVHFMAAAVNQAVAFGAKQALLAEHTKTIVALRESEARFRNAFDHAAIGMALVATDGRWLKANQKLCDILGYFEPELRAMTFQALIQPDDLRSYLARVGSLLAGDIGTFQMEMRYAHKSEAILWILLSVSMLRDGMGKPLYFIAQIQDITERKRAEEALIMQARVLHNMTEGVCLSDEDGLIVFNNAALERMFGYNPEELRGKHVNVLNSYPPDENSRILAQISHHVTTHGIWSGEIRNRRKEGDIFTTWASISLLEMSGRKYFVCVQEDITEKKRADEQIKNSLREKDVLLKEIHHRVKNNLQVISSLLNLQSGYIQDNQTHELFRESQNRVRTMALIHEKLYQSQDLARIDFGEYVLSLVSMLFRSYGTTSGSIKLETRIDPVFLNIDTAIPVGLLINELLSNSLKHAFPADQGGTICIDFHAHDGDQFVLIFRDDGVGVPQEFDLDKAPSLGLRLVKILTNQIGGELTFHRNGGTEFKIIFKEQKDKERK